jgi:hypothetical protein
MAIHHLRARGVDGSATGSPAPPAPAGVAMNRYPFPVTVWMKRGSSGSSLNA